MNGYDETLSMIANRAKLQKPAHPPIISSDTTLDCPCEIADQILGFWIYRDLRNIICAYAHSRYCQFDLRQEYLANPLCADEPCHKNSFRWERKMLQSSLIMITNQRDSRGLALMKYLMCLNQKDLPTAICFLSHGNNLHLARMVPDCFIYDDEAALGYCAWYITQRWYRFHSPRMIDSAYSNKVLLLLMKDVQLQNQPSYVELLFSAKNRDTSVWILTSADQRFVPPSHSRVFDMVFVDLQMQCPSKLPHYLRDCFDSINTLNRYLKAHTQCKNCWLVCLRGGSMLHFYVPPVLAPFQLRSGSMFPFAAKYESEA